MRDNAKTCGEAQQGQLTRFTSIVDAALHGTQDRMQGALDASAETSRAATEAVSSHRSTAAAFSTTLANGLSALREESRSYLVNKLEIDQPTGSTPRKREATAAPTWHLVPAKRSRALEQHRARTEAAEAEGITSLSLVYPESESGNFTRDEEDDELGEALEFAGDETIMAGSQRTIAARPKTSMQRDSRSASVASNASESQSAHARGTSARGGALRTLSNGNVAAGATSSAVVQPVEVKPKLNSSDDAAATGKGRPAPGTAAPRNKRAKH